MSANKNYTKSLVTIFSLLTIFLFTPFLAYSSEDLDKILKTKLDEININFSKSLIPLENGFAVPLFENIALAPLSLMKEDKKILAIDSKLKIFLFKNEEPLKKVAFKSPDKNLDIFFLLNLNESLNSLNILLVNGKINNNLVKIDGKHVLGSLLISLDLNPMGIVVQNSKNTSEVLLLKNVEQEINKLINRKRGWIGIQAQTISEELGKLLFTDHGVVVTNIYSGGPAYKAGIQRGDAIIEVNTIPIKDLKDLQNLLNTKFSGEEIQIKILRNKKKMEFKLVLEDPPENIDIDYRKPQILSIQGLEVTEIPTSIRQSLKENIKGVFINRVMENSPALGILKKGDIVVEINKKNINNLQEFNAILSELSKVDLLMLVYRQNSFQYVIIPLQKFR